MKNVNNKIDKRIQLIIQDNLNSWLSLAVLLQLVSVPAVLGSIQFLWFDLHENFIDTIIFSGIILTFLWIIFLIGCSSIFIFSFNKEKGSKSTQKYVIEPEFNKGKGFINKIIITLSRINKKS